MTLEVYVFIVNFKKNKRSMVPILKNCELLVENEDWSLLKAKVLAHLENCLRSSPL